MKRSRSRGGSISSESRLVNFKRRTEALGAEPLKGASAPSLLVRDDLRVVSRDVRFR